jgi:hypothetical protein
MKDYEITLVIFDSPNSKIETLIEFIPIFEKQIGSFEKGKVYIIKKDK